MYEIVWKMALAEHSEENTKSQVSELFMYEIEIGKVLVIVTLNAM